MGSIRKWISVLTATALVQTGMLPGSVAAEVVAGTTMELGNEIVSESFVPVKTDVEGNTVFTFANDGIIVTTGDAAEAEGYSVSGTELTISEAGTYYIDGRCNDGAIKIKKKTKGVVLVLNGLELSSESTAPLVMAGNTQVELVVYGENVLTDGEANNDKTNPENENAENAVVKAKSGSELTVSGGGKLKIEGNAKNGMKSNGSLVIDDVNLDITAVDDGISNEDHIIINRGNVTIKSGGDGIKSGADDEPKGSVTINGGKVTIDATADGIQATSEVTINGGEIDIMTHGGSHAVYDKDDDSYPSAKGLKASGSYEVVNEETGEVEEVDATQCTLTVNGGTIHLDCADDAIHSDGNVSILGGNLEIASGDDGIHGDYITTIGVKDGKDEDLTISITDCVEGIEGAEVYLNSGTTKVFALDDGINAANSDLHNYEYKIEVYGGNHYVSCSEGDGFDSNGSMLFAGGVTTVLASSGAGEGDPLDCDGTLEITGGIVLGIGTYSPMGRVPDNENYVEFGAPAGMRDDHQPGQQPGEPDRQPGEGQPGEPGQQPPQMPGVTGGAVGMPGQMTSNISIKDGDTVVVKDASGQAIASAVASWLPDASSYSAGYVFCWSEEIDPEKIYTLYVNDEKVASSDEDNLVEPPMGEMVPGDANQDGRVTLEDAQLVLRAALRIVELEDSRLADVNQDGQVTLEDAQKVLRIALKIEDASIR